MSLPGQNDSEKKRDRRMSLERQTRARGGIAQNSIKSQKARLLNTLQLQGAKRNASNIQDEYSYPQQAPRISINPTSGTMAGLAKKMRIRTGKSTSGDSRRESVQSRNQVQRLQGIPSVLLLAKKTGSGMSSRSLARLAMTRSERALQQEIMHCVDHASKEEQRLTAVLDIVEHIITAAMKTILLKDRAELTVAHCVADAEHEMHRAVQSSFMISYSDQIFTDSTNLQQLKDERSTEPNPCVQDTWILQVHEASISPADSCQATSTTPKAEASRTDMTQKQSLASTKGRRQRVNNKRPAQLLPIAKNVTLNTSRTIKAARKTDGVVNTRKAGTHNKTNREIRDNLRKLSEASQTRHTKSPLCQRGGQITNSRVLVRNNATSSRAAIPDKLKLPAIETIASPTATSSHAHIFLQSDNHIDSTHFMYSAAGRHDHDNTSKQYANFRNQTTLNAADIPNHAVFTLEYTIRNAANTIRQREFPIQKTM